MTRPAIDAGVLLPVTVHAPAHLEIGGTGDPFHGRNLAVASGADKSGADMHHVREIDVVRHSVDPDPGDRLPFIPILHQLFDFRGVLRDEQVAGPAVRHRGDAGNARLRSMTVTKEARNAAVTGMNFVAEGERLDRGAVPKIQRQIVHERKGGDKNDRGSDHPPDKPRYFHPIAPFSK